MRVKCHYCTKGFQHFGNYSKFLWCSDSCKEKDKLKRKESESK